MFSLMLFLFAFHGRGTFFPGSWLYVGSLPWLPLTLPILIKEVQVWDIVACDFANLKITSSFKLGSVFFKKGGYILTAFINVCHWSWNGVYNSSVHMFRGLKTWNGLCVTLL